MKREHVNPAPEVERHILPGDGRFPNNANLPLLLYLGVLRIHDDPAAFEKLFEENDWLGAWRNGIYPFHHYHSTSHEVLGVYSGRATVRLGGDGEGGLTVTLRPGDMLVIPAGVAHCNLGSDVGFGVVGAYPGGRSWDLLRGEPGDRPKADENIARLPLPATDPVYGSDGPLMRLWAQRVLDNGKRATPSQPLHGPS